VRIAGWSSLRSGPPPTPLPAQDRETEISTAFLSCHWLGIDLPYLNSLIINNAEIQRHLAAWVVWKWRRPRPLADQLFLTCLAFNTRDLYLVFPALRLSCRKKQKTDKFGSVNCDQYCKRTDLAASIVVILVRLVIYTVTYMQSSVYRLNHAIITRSFNIQYIHQQWAYTARRRRQNWICHILYNKINYTLLCCCGGCVFAFITVLWYYLATPLRRVKQKNNHENEPTYRYCAYNWLTGAILQNAARDTRTYWHR